MYNPEDSNGVKRITPIYVNEKYEGCIPKSRYKPTGVVLRVVFEQNCKSLNEFHVWGAYYVGLYILCFHLHSRSSSVF